MLAVSLKKKNLAGGGVVLKRGGFLKVNSPDESPSGELPLGKPPRLVLHLTESSAGCSSHELPNSLVPGKALGETPLVLASSETTFLKATSPEARGACPACRPLRAAARSAWVGRREGW